MIGKIVGSLFGLLLLGPISPLFGVLVGFYLGHRFDCSLRQFFRASFDEQPIAQNKPFVEATFSVMGHLSKLDGRVSKQEIDYAEHVISELTLSSAMRQVAVDAFSQGKISTFDLNQSLTKLKLHFFINPSLLRRFLEIQLRAASIDGPISKKQKDVLDYIAQNLGFQPFFQHRGGRQQGAYGYGGRQQGHWQRQQHPFGGESGGLSLDEAYRILGVSSDVDQKGLKQAYRKQIGQHHPDRVMAKNAGDAAIKQANEQTQKIQKAYAFISKRRGYKGF